MVPVIPQTKKNARIKRIQKATTRVEAHKVVVELAEAVAAEGEAVKKVEVVVVDLVQEVVEVEEGEWVAKEVMKAVVVVVAKKE